VHRLNSDFANYIRENGQKRKLCKVVASESNTEPESEAESEVDDGQMLVNDQELNQWVKRVSF
jgi:hypothetical protein